jgi:hypothetical protein
MNGATKRALVLGGTLAIVVAVFGLFATAHAATPVGPSLNPPPAGSSPPSSTNTTTTTTTNTTSTGGTGGDDDSGDPGLPSHPCDHGHDKDRGHCLGHHWGWDKGKHTGWEQGKHSGWSTNGKDLDEHHGADDSAPVWALLVTSTRYA